MRLGPALQTLLPLTPRGPGPTATSLGSTTAEPEAPPGWEEVHLIYGWRQQGNSSCISLDVRKRVILHLEEAEQKLGSVGFCISAQGWISAEGSQERPKSPSTKN